MDMRSIKAYNDSWSYLLVVIDVLSKYAQIEPLTDKSSKNVSNAFHRILSRSNYRTPVYLQTDKGKEFIEKEMKDVLCKTFCIGLYAALTQKQQLPKDSSEL